MSPRLPIVVGISIAVSALGSFASKREAPAAPPAASQTNAAPTADTAWPPKIKRVLPPLAPPLGVAELKQVTAARDELKAALEKLPKDPPFDAENSLDERPASSRAEVEIFLKAIDFAIRHNEFFDPKRDLARVEAIKKIGLERAAALAQGKTPWADARGTIMRGFRSELDDSAQPYAAFVPEKLDLSKPVPLYIWLHGRGDKQCDLQFISAYLDPKKNPGPLTPDDAIVVYPFGRYCNGFKSAGEVDILEVIADVNKRYKIDFNRVVVAGFSMGGAGAWHLGAHFGDYWCAVHAGAGFVDTRRYQNITPEKMPAPYVQTLWGLYDVPDYRRNLLGVPTIAYSGADDKQKQAADIMEAELAKEGMKLTHLIGPGVAHKYEPQTLAEIQKRLKEIVAKGKSDPPATTSFQTKTLRYHMSGQLIISGLERHWVDSRVDWKEENGKVSLKTKNVDAFMFSTKKPARYEIDGKEIAVNAAGDETDGWLSQSFVKTADAWSRVKSDDLVARENGRKRPDLQGPIDDVYNFRHTVVVPDERADASAVDRWAQFESQHALKRWAALMRGDAIRKTPAEVTEDDIQDAAVVLWGTPKTNRLIAEALENLPIRWNEKTVGIGDLEFDATKVVPVLIYPNPDFPYKYLVLNSGLTFREGHDHTNSQQNPKLPDWAMIDITEPPSELYPGKVVAAGFFDEEWKYDPTRTYKSGDSK